MKKFPGIIIFIIMSSANSFAQNTDTSMHKTAVAVCDCLTKSNISDKSSQEQMEQAFLGCIFTSAPDLVNKIMAGGEDMEKASEEIGTQLAMELMKTGCPAFTKIAASMMANNSDSTMAMEMPLAVPQTSESIQSADGVVTAVNEKDFTYITIKTADGHEKTFIYYDYVNGSDNWIKDAATQLKNKKVSITYKEAKVYQPKFKQFMNVNQLVSLVIK